ncbi:MAG: ribbon-helix-helix protein, CopG family [Candidatus Heimdallarchaeota archaeon]|nr:ribbon-helix-helix protein, CopG family [Candidatus Heimdallarchaeota archaeon]
MIRALDDLVLAGKFPNRSEAIRAAVRDLLKESNLTPGVRKTKPTRFKEVIRGVKP